LPFDRKSAERRILFADFERCLIVRAIEPSLQCVVAVPSFLAHRVAHLITNGIDPRRLMLLTFSRRAAVEMTRRVERIAANYVGANASVITETLTWSGTFHAIGARLLREYALQIGLDRSFTIHDRADSEDLLNLVRHDLGLLEY
jgi:DNA helicase II / ATP-dependent DNA helicase PcrA